MGNPLITATTPSTGTLVESSYDEPDYADAYVVETNDLSVEEFATAFFLSQPRWLARVSMNLSSEQSRRDAIGSRDYVPGTSVGAWQVQDRNDDEIVFGEHMGFMEYRFSMLRRPDGKIEASTVVQYRKRFAWLYFPVIRPFHTGFVKIALGNAAKYASADSVGEATAR